jgi:methylthioribose-1-phosphate isomerase
MEQDFRTLWWDEDAVCLIDQRLLPSQHVVVRCTTLEEVARAIKTLQVRGAPAIGWCSSRGAEAPRRSRCCWPS